MTENDDSFSSKGRIPVEAAGLKGSCSAGFAVGDDGDTALQGGLVAVALAQQEIGVECFTRGSPLWDLALALDARLGPISNGSARRIVHRLPSELWEKNPDLEQAVPRAVSANARCVTAHLCGELGLPEALPGETRHLARTWARSRISAEALLLVFSSAHEVMWAQWFEAIEEADFSADTRRALHKYVSQFLFSFAERMGVLSTGEYERELVSFRPGPVARRTQAVKSILDGKPPDATALDYDLAGQHLGMIATGDGAAGILQLVATACASPLLVVPGTDSASTWAWIHLNRSGVDTAKRTLRASAVGARWAVSCGRPGAGLEGFRRTHQQACEAMATHDRSERAGYLAYEDVALESLASQDPVKARQFVDDELGSLVGNRHGERWLEALTAYFAAGHNAAAAAAHLGVHHQTITNRLRQIEDVLGRTVSSRRAELEVALRLRRSLDWRTVA